MTASTASTLPRQLAAAAWLVAAAFAAPAVQAANFTLTGNLVYNTDVARVSFSLDVDGAVSVWTNSWLAGVNFDPVVAVWSRSAGGGYTLVAEVDDDDRVGTGQGSFDAGIGFARLAAGQYLVTLAASPNYAAGTTLAAGFTFDGSTPIAIADWNQPGYDPNANDQKGTFWRLNLSGVDQAAAVPEPSTWVTLALGLALIGFSGRRRR